MGMILDDKTESPPPLTLANFMLLAGPAMIGGGVIGSLV